MESSHAERIAAAVGFFGDVGWGGVEEQRRSRMTRFGEGPRGGLLGGAPKSSKLAALAAARKKQSEEKKVADDVKESQRALNLLDRLGSNKGESPKPIAKTEESFGIEKLRVTGVFKPKKEAPEKESAPSMPDPATLQPPLPVFKAKPSTFAQALCGVETAETQGASLEPNVNLSRSRSSSLLFGVPYATNDNFLKSDPFAKPSPDDVVLAAQRTGTLK